ncbi:MAG: hypothetical protein AAF512_08860 [Pseudomonadota bacterium]
MQSPLRFLTMAFSLWLLSGLNIAQAQTDCSAVTDIPQAECSALLDLFNATNGANWAGNNGWNADNAPCNWFGVFCENGSVSQLNLPANQLAGELPNSLGNLTNLTVLSLFENSLTGAIPPEIGNLSNLTLLYLTTNSLAGSIPNTFGNLTNVTDLRLDRNMLSGPIPPELGNLANVTILYFSTNSLTGSIPSELGNMSNLTDLRMEQNMLSGPIPPELGNLANLTVLYLFGNPLTGTIPSTLSNLTNLTDLRIFENMLTGSIPSELGNLTQLTVLSLRSNQLSGPIPDTLCSLTELTILSLRDNQLSGEVPTSFGNLTNLTALALSNNQLSGQIPDNFGNLTNLNLLWLHQNMLRDTIPPGLASLTSIPDADAVETPSLRLDNNDCLTSMDAALIAFLDAKNPDWRTQNDCSVLDTADLTTFSPAQLAALSTSEISNFTADNLAAMPMNILRDSSPRDAANFLVNLDATKIMPADVTALLPTGWSINPISGALSVPPGTPIALRTLPPPSNVPANVQLPSNTPDLNSSFGLGGTGGVPVLESMNQALTDNGIAGLNFTQDAFGTLNLTGEIGGTNFKLAFTADADALSQAPGNTASGVQLTANNQYIIVTREGSQIPLVPAPQNVADLASILGMDTQVNLGDLGDVIIRRPDEAPLVALFGFAVTDAPAGLSPGLHLSSPSQRMGTPLGLVVFSDGTAQQIFPYIPAPDTFAMTALALSSAVEEVRFDLLDGTAQVRVSGETFILIPQSTSTVRQLGTGETVIPGILINSNLTLDYTVGEGGEELSSSIAISP